MANEVARHNRQIRIDKLKEQRLLKQSQTKCDSLSSPSETTVKQEPVSTSTTVIGQSKSRIEARKIRNRESAVISRKRKMDAMMELTVRCERLENENKYLKSLLMDSTNGRNNWKENGAFVNIGPAVF